MPKTSLNLENVFVFRMTPQQNAYIKKMGGSKYLRQLIDDDIIKEAEKTHRDMIKKLLLLGD